MIKIAQSESEISFQENNIAVIEINDKKICLGKYNNQLFAFAYKCPHASSLLSEGWIDMQGNVVCPLHNYKFSLKTGRHPADGGYYMKHWRVEKKEDGIYIDNTFI